MSFKFYLFLIAAFILLALVAVSSGGASISLGDIVKFFTFGEIDETKELIVLHDLNLASLFCDEILMLKDGAVRYRGRASELFTPQIIKEIYGFEALIAEENGVKFILPKKEKL